MNESLKKIIESLLKLWIKTRCKKIDRIEVVLKYLNNEIFRGKLPSIKVVAEKINLNDIYIDYAEIESAPINIEINLQKRYLNIKNDFTIEGNIRLDEECLRKILFHKSWKWIGVLLTKELIGVEKLQSISIEDDFIHIIGTDKTENCNKEIKLTVKANSGKLIILDTKSLKNLTLPMEDAIYIHEASVKSGMLLITANSIIKT